MRVVVCVKQVPDPNSGEARVDPATKRMVRAGVANVLDPGVEVALEAALQLAERAGGTVDVIAMGPESAVEAVRRALAMGAAEGILITDPDLAGSDALGTAKALAGALRDEGYDLIFCATESTDSATGMVPGMLAELLGVPHLSFIRSLEVRDGAIQAQRVTERGYQVLGSRTPAVVAIASGSYEPRYPALKGIMAAKRKQVRQHAVSALGLTSNDVGAAGARERVVEFLPVVARSAGVTIEDDGSGAARIVELLEQRGVL